MCIRDSSDPSHRTPAALLRRLSAGWMLFEMPGTRSGDWDNFEVRRAAMALNDPPFPPKIEQAKRAAVESKYIRLLQREPKLRRAIIRLGSHVR